LTLYGVSSKKLIENLKVIIMGQEIGKITKIENGQMVVQLTKGKHCNICVAKSACFFEDLNSPYRLIHLPYQAKIKVGNWVSLYYRESSRILSALLVLVL
jgi:positive regulator of sigma E activity